VKLFSFVAKAVDYALPNEWHRGINGGRYWSDSSVAPDMDHRSSSSVAAGEYLANGGSVSVGELVKQWLHWWILRCNAGKGTR